MIKIQEDLILSHLIYTEEYGRKVLPFLKPEYFHNDTDCLIYGLIDKYVTKYNSFPTKDVLYIELSNVTGINEEQFKEARNKIAQYEVELGTSVEWLVDKTEGFCKNKSLHNGLHKSILIMEEQGDENLAYGEIPKILQDAISVDFNSAIGHDFLEDFSKRYDTYTKQEERIPFGVHLLNKITGGGLPKKSLNCVIAPTGVGKTLIMCSMAANNLLDGLNVLYITLEMAEERISQRIDANLLDTPINLLSCMGRSEYQSKIEALKKTTTGRLIVKEYPTVSAGSGHFRHLINELRIKKNFIPHIIYIDYLNLAVSSRIKPGSQVNSYTYVKAIAEELRGLAVEFDLPIFTATQTNRGGLRNSDVDLEDTSDSIGLPMTLDFFFAAMQPEEFEEQNKMLFKQLKNRYGDIAYYRKFAVGVDKARMRVFDLPDDQQEELINSGAPVDEPVMDNTKFGMDDLGRSKTKFDKNKLKGFF